MSKRFLLTLATVLIIGVMAGVGVFLAKGYRFSSKTNTVAGTGILSVTTLPDQASIFLDGHLFSASNTNINSLPPKDYDVKIIKDGFIPWEKTITIKEGLVAQVKATLFPAIPTVYPLTFNGVSKLTVSTDNQRFVFIVPQDATQSALISSSTDRTSGVWIWDMVSSGLGFSGSVQPHRIANILSGVDYSKASLRFSPDSSQVLLSLSDRELLLDAGSFNDPGKDITAILNPTLAQWDAQTNAQKLAKLQTILSMSLQQEASSAAILKWAPNDSKYLYSTDGKTDFEVVNILDGKKSPLTISEGTKSPAIDWLGDSLHLVMVEDMGQGCSIPKSTVTPIAGLLNSQLPLTECISPGKISIIEADGSNKDEIYAGNFDLNSVISWPDWSRLAIVSSLATPTANKPNLFGINLK